MSKWLPIFSISFIFKLTSICHPTCGFTPKCFFKNKCPSNSQFSFFSKLTTHLLYNTQKMWQTLIMLHISTTNKLQLFTFQQLMYMHFPSSAIVDLIFIRLKPMLKKTCFAPRKLEFWMMNELCKSSCDDIVDTRLVILR